MQILFWFHNKAKKNKSNWNVQVIENFIYHTRYLHAKNVDLFAKIQYDYGRPERFQPLSEPCVNATSA